MTGPDWQVTAGAVRHVPMTGEANMRVPAPQITRPAIRHQRRATTPSCYPPAVGSASPSPEREFENHTAEEIRLPDAQYRRSVLKMGGPKELETAVFQVLVDIRPDPMPVATMARAKFAKEKHSISQTPIP